MNELLQLIILDVCPNLIEETCRKNGSINCPNYHHPSPYLWYICGEIDSENFPPQLFQQNGRNFKTCHIFGHDAGKILEIEYCKPEVEQFPLSNGKCGFELKVDFHKMMISSPSGTELFSLRRISTPPKAYCREFNASFLYATNWKWFWRNEQNTWKEVVRRGFSAYET